MSDWPFQLYGSWFAHIVVLVVLVEAGFTITFNVVVVAHWFIAGVKVYVPDTVLLTMAGVHVPEMLSKEVTGKTGARPPEQTGGIDANVGVTSALIDTLFVTGIPHCPAAGVNVNSVVPTVVVLIVAGLHVP